MSKPSFCLFASIDIFKSMFRALFKFSTVKSFGVVGSGQMGTGIAIVANKVAKLPVVLFDSNEQALQKS